MKNKIEALMRRYEEAVAAHAFKGSQPPEAWPDIDTELGVVRHLVRVALSPGNIEKATALITEARELLEGSTL